MLSAAEKAALRIYERLPLSIRHRLFYGRPFLQWLTLLRGAEQWDLDTLQAYTFEQTRKLLIHAKKHVPYYRKLFLASGFDPERMHDLDDLSQLPYLTKETIRDNAEELVDERIPLRSLIRRHTSGSSGIPLTIYRSRGNEAAFMAFRTSILSRVGHAPKAKEVMLWPDVYLGRKSVPFMRYGNRLVLSIRYLRDEWLSRYLDMIREFEPQFVLGYPSALIILAVAAGQAKRLSCRNVRAVIAYSETLYGWQRKLLQETFGARVFSMYGMTERAAIGGECETSLELHFHPLYGVTEFETSNHGYKELVATGFTTYEMPFIRYKTGDLISGYSQSCRACGRRHPVVGTIMGRTNELLVGKNNQLIPVVTAWTGAFRNVLHYQLIQKQPGIVRLNIVRSKAFSIADQDHILHKLDKTFGEMKDRIEVELDFVDHIPRRSSGKINMVEQQLDMHNLIV